MSRDISFSQCKGSLFKHTRCTYFQVHLSIVLSANALEPTCDRVYAGAMKSLLPKLPGRGFLCQITDPDSTSFTSCKWHFQTRFGRELHPILIRVSWCLKHCIRLSISWIHTKHSVSHNPATTCTNDDSSLSQICITRPWKFAYANKHWCYIGSDYKHRKNYVFAPLVIKWLCS